MKKLLTVLLLLFLICCKESGVQLAKPSTFVRYFNGGFPDQAQAIIETTDKGFLILANTQPTSANNHYRIKLIKTDSYGNEVWQMVYPAYGATVGMGDYRGFGLTAVHDNSGAETGYIIAGDSINGTNHALMMLQVSQTGIAGAPKVFSNKRLNTVLNVQGIGITQSTLPALHGDFFILGQSYAGKGDMFFAQVNSTTLDTVWSRTYGSATSQLANRIFLQDSVAYWGGTRIDVTTSLMRFVRAGFNSKSALFDLSYPVGSGWNLTGTDICQYGYDFALVGSSVAASNQYDSIVFNRVSANGNVLAHKGYELRPGSDPAFTQGVQPGNSICSTNDGGLLILGTLALDAQGTDTDYYLIKIDSKGGEQWRKQHGSKFIDIGSKILQASDGGFIVLGTTTLANVQSIFLMKTDPQGNIQ